MKKVGLKEKKISKTQAKLKANAAFSKYVRNKYSVDGYATCYTCGLVKPWKELQAGHGIAGRNNAVLYMEEVVRPQCAGCNIWGRGKLHIFTPKLIREMGVNRYQELAEEAEKLVTYSVQDYLDIEILYKIKLKDE